MILDFVFFQRRHSCVGRGGLEWVERALAGRWGGGEQSGVGGAGGREV